MKICYVWVNEFKNLKNFGVNLTSDYKFKYDVDKNFITRKRSFGVPKDFFGESISDVIALIGRNGSGKSNALELICLALKNGKAKVKSDFLIVVENEGKYFCYYNFTSMPGKEPSTNFNIRFLSEFRDVQDLRVVYFSNVYDGRRYLFDKSIRDISLNSEVRKSRFPFGSGGNKFHQQFDFIKSNAFEKINIIPPNEILLKIRRNNRLSKSVGVNLVKQSYYPLVKDFEVIFHERINEQKPIYRLFNVLKYKFFFDSLLFLFKNNDSPELEEQVYRILRDCLQETRNIKTDELMDALIVQLSNLWGEYYASSSKNKKIKSGFFSKVELLLCLKSDFYYMGGVIHDIEGPRNNIVDSFIFSLEDSDSALFIEDITRNFAGERYFDLDWVGMSSGHKAYLNLFSSISSALKGARDSHILLCIDEGDLYLHPQWQVEFFDTLVKALPEITSKKVQLVLTSHSPFLLSDLPNQNLTILDKSYEMEAFDGVELGINTFGANLFDLYSEAFFLKDTRRGKFSDRKIDTLIRDITDSKSSLRKKKECKAVANLVGDELLSYKIDRLISND